MGEPEDTRLGRLAVERGLVTAAQVAACSEMIQSLPDGSRPRLGEVLVQKGILKPEQIRALLAEQAKAILVCSQCRARFNVRAYDPAKTYRCNKCEGALSPTADASSVRVDDSYVAKEGDTTTDRVEMMAKQMQAKKISAASAATRTREAAVRKAGMPRRRPGGRPGPPRRPRRPPPAARPS